MRIFEMILILTISLIVLLHLLNKSGGVKKLLLFLSGSILFPLHAWYEGIRWQLYPIYLLIPLLSILTFLSIRVNKRFMHISNRILTILSGIVIILSGLLCYAFPVYKLPQPTGDYDTGTITYELTDPIRPAIYSEDLEDNRKIRYQMWYPIDENKGYERAPWLQDGVSVSYGVSRLMGFPDLVLSHTSLVQSNSYLEAPISNQESRYPVVIISHGWTGFRNLHSDIAEQLASHGYIVVSIDHTYGSVATVFENGEVAYMNPEALPSSDEVNNFLDYGNTLVNTYAGDIELVINQLDHLNTGQQQSMFVDKLDLDNLGLVGHSTGAGAAVSTTLRDSRVKAVFGMDAWVAPIDHDLPERGMHVPAVFLRSEEWEDKENNINLYSILSNSENAKLFQIKGSKHLDFSMVYMYSPLTKPLGITGELDGRTSAKIQREFILSFFDKELKNSQEVNLNDLNTKYNAVIEIDDFTYTK